MNGVLILAEPAATQKFAEAQTQLTAVRIPPVDSQPLRVAAVASAKFESNVAGDLQAGEH
jgi:hypothetical protein